MRNSDTRKAVSLIGAALSFLVLAQCSLAHKQEKPKFDNLTNQDNRVIGEYLVLLKDANQLEILKSHFSKYEVTSVEKIEPTRFLIKLKTDPGVLEIAQRAKGATFILE